MANLNILEPHLPAVRRMLQSAKTFHGGKVERRPKFRLVSRNQKFHRFFSGSRVLVPAAHCQQYNFWNDTGRYLPPPSNQLCHLIVGLFMMATQLNGWWRTLRVGTIQSILPLDNWSASCVRSNG